MIVSLLCLLAFAQADAAKDLEKLQGAWTVTEVVSNGETHTDLKLKLTFKKNEVSVEGDDEVQRDYGKFTITLDPGTMPACLDVKVTVGNQKGAKLEGIYELKGDELKICVKLTGNDRPGEFAAPGGSNQVLLTLKKEK